jgi:glycosyltransferase involved in cell wall biosynthesis
MVAKLTKYKDHETLLRAFAALRTNDADNRMHLLLVGRHGDTALPLKALAFDLGLSGHLHLVGDLESVSDCYAATDLAVHSSVKEGCPNVVLEAMAHGLPVCGTDISGIRQALGNEAGAELYAPPGDVDALSRIMRQLIEDGELRKSLGQRNRQRLRDYFSPEQLTRNVLLLIASHQHS